MCGIYGWRLNQTQPTTLNTSQRAIMSMTLALEMESRGRDSFGAAIWMPGNTQPDIYKCVGSVGTKCGLVAPETGMSMIMAMSEATTVMAHTRHATVGKVTRENSHPFCIGQVVGVHNGSVYNYKALNELYGRDYDVDSMHIFGHIDDAERERKPVKMDELDASGAFVFSLDRENHANLYAVRSPHGSLEIGRLYTDEKAEAGTHLALVFASTRYAINRVAERLGLEVRFFTIQSEKLQVITPEGHLIVTTDVHFHSKPTVTTNFSVSHNSTTTQPGNHNHHSSQSSHNCSVRPPANTVAQVPDLGDPVEVRVLSSSVGDIKYVKPLASNLIGSGRFGKTFIPRSGGTVAVRICHQCLDPLDDHLWAACCNERCQTPPEELCTIAVPVCLCCGHYMIDEIHVPAVIGEPNGQAAPVYCLICACKCNPEERKSKGERKRIRRRVTNALAAMRSIKDEDEADAEDDTIGTSDDGKGECRACKFTLYSQEAKRTGLCGYCRNSGGFIDGESCDDVDATDTDLKIDLWSCKSCPRKMEQFLVTAASRQSGLCGVCRMNQGIDPIPTREGGVRGNEAEH